MDIVNVNDKNEGKAAKESAPTFEDLLKQIYKHDPIDQPAKPEQKPEQQFERYTEADAQKLGKNAADLILRNDDFGYGVKRERLSDMFKDAADKGPEAIRQLTDAINKELVARKSPLRIEGSYSTQQETVNEAPKVTDGRDIYIYPQYYKHTYAGANFTLKDRSTGFVEDKANVQGRHISSEYLGTKDPGRSDDDIIRKFQLKGLLNELEIQPSDRKR